METKESITSRPWFICPTWASVVPLLVDAIARTSDHGESADAARAELLRLARFVDEQNERMASLREIAQGAIDSLDDDEFSMARLKLTRIVRALEVAE